MKERWMCQCVWPLDWSQKVYLVNLNAFFNDPIQVTCGLHLKLQSDNIHRLQFQSDFINFSGRTNWHGVISNPNHLIPSNGPNSICIVHMQMHRTFSTCQNKKMAWPHKSGFHFASNFHLMTSKFIVVLVRYIWTDWPLDDNVIFMRIRSTFPVPYSERRFFCGRGCDQ